MLYTTTMTSKGQVTIPVAIRRTLGLTPGEQVRFKVTRDSVCIERDTWKSDLDAMRARVRADLQTRHIKPLTNEQLKRAAEDAAAAEASQRYLRSKK